MNTFLRTISRRTARFVATFAVVAASLLGITLSATPAHAATTTGGCFRSSSAGMSVEGVPAQLQAWTNQGWYTVWSGAIPRSGCVSVNTYNVRNYYLRFAVNYSRYGATWYGTSPYNATPGNGSVHLGTTTVYCSGCHFG